jgi:hypothetical protein
MSVRPLIGAEWPDYDQSPAAARPDPKGIVAAFERRGFRFVCDRDGRMDILDLWRRSGQQGRRLPPPDLMSLLYENAGWVKGWLAQRADPMRKKEEPHVGERI